MSNLPTRALITNLLYIDRRHGPGHGLSRTSIGMGDLAELVFRLRQATQQEVAEYLDLIDQIPHWPVKEGDEARPMKCGKCLAKLWLFARRIAEGRLPERAEEYLLRARKQKGIYDGSTTAQLQAEVDAWIAAKLQEADSQNDAGVSSQ